MQPDNVTFRGDKALATNIGCTYLEGGKFGSSLSINDMAANNMEKEKSIVISDICLLISFEFYFPFIKY